jgi:hypothetical protein
MDARRFDTIAKTWVSIPRRRVLSGLALGALGPLLGLDMREASARSCRRSSQCPGKKICVNHTCVSKCGTPGTCSTAFPFGCRKDASCFCALKPGGGGVCTQGGGICAAVGCTGQSDCDPGLVCVTGCCDPPRFTCQPPCGSI